MTKDVTSDAAVCSIDDLANRKCVPCSGGVPRLTGAQIESFAGGIEGWQIVDEHHLTKHYDCPDFRTAQAFVNRVGETAEEEGHHPDIAFGWGYADLKIFTHAIDGLSESDFILAAKIDRLST